MWRPRVFVTGGRGMLARTLAREWAEDFEVVPADLPETDVTDARSVAAALDAAAPLAAVVNCAAITAVDKCEGERAAAFAVNAEGAGIVAAECAARGIRLVHISTDYVFDGGPARPPFRESDEATGGRTVYGQSKFAGELAVRRACPDHVVARVSWLYGAGGPSFVHSMMALSRKGLPELAVVDDQRGNPTSCAAVAAALRLLLPRHDLRGTFHLTCEGEATWAEFAREVFRLAGVAQAVRPCSTDEFPRPAPRPADSRLAKERLRAEGLPPMPHWSSALARFMASEFPPRTDLCAENE